MKGTVVNLSNMSDSERDDESEINKPPYAFEDVRSSGYGCCGYMLIFFSGLLWFLMLPLIFPIFTSIKVVKEYERAIVLRLGRIKRVKKSPVIYGSGIRFILPCTDQFMRIDMRTKVMEVPHQDVLTADSVTCSVNATICLRITDAAKALLRTEKPFDAAFNMGISTMRDVIGQHSLSTLLRQREDIDKMIERDLMRITEPWGVLVEKVGIKDVNLPADMRRSMAIEAEASRTARAKVIDAQGELNSAKILTEAASEMDKHPSSMQLRYLQTLNNIAAEQNSTIIFPLPMQLLNFMDQQRKKIS